MCFDEARLRGNSLEVFENRIEALDVSDLKDAVVLGGKLDQFGSLRGVIGHRFFEQQMFALLQQRFGDFEMRGGGGNDVESVTGLGGLGDGTESANPVFVGELAGG